MSDFINIGSIIGSKIKSEFVVFRQSILFFPVIFTLIALVLFIITSNIDRAVFPDDLSIDIPYIESLIFAGNANAARSILSTIASGWATILGVAYSVTLITLQLSTSRYTSHLINRFEQDKINQITLGWFIFIVAFSLLVLKTVRTEEIQLASIIPFALNNTSSTATNTPDLTTLESTAFTPILGVNVAVSIAITGLFIFVLFLKNISSYLRPNILISDIVSKIIDSLKKYENRNFEKEAIDKAISDKVIQFKSDSTGIITYINWQHLNDAIHQELFKRKEKDNEKEDIKNKIYKNNSGYWLEWVKAVGERVNKNDIMGTLYKYKLNGDDQSHLPMFTSTKRLQNLPEENLLDYSSHDREDHRLRNNKEYPDRAQIHKLQSGIISAIQITKDRNLGVDPLYGIDLIQSIAVKASNSRDIDIVKSCISGLFYVLRYIIENGDPMGRPFTIGKENKKRKRTNHNKGNDEQNAQGADINNKNKEQRDQTKRNNRQSSNSKIPRSDDDDDKNSASNHSFLVIVNPDEVSLVKVILSELSVIISTSTSSDKIHIYNNLIIEYTRLSLYLIRQGKVEEFVILTEWISHQIENTSEIFEQELVTVFVSDVLIKFKKQLIFSENPFVYNSFVTLMDPILNKFELSSQNK